METLIFKVRPSKEAEFAKLVKKFNRCLKASGLQEIQPILLGECDIDIKVGSTNLHYSVKGKEYHLSFPDEILGLKGYRFIGEYRRIDQKWHRTMHSDDIHDEMEVCEANMRCDHCGRDIKNRNGYFFFRDPENKLVVVGSTCVDAFLGFNVKELLLALGDATEFEHCCGEPDFDKEIIGIGIKSFVSLVSNATNSFTTWKSKSSDDSTAAWLKNTLYDLFFGRGNARIAEVEDADGIIGQCRAYWDNVYKFDDLTINSRKSIQGNFVPLRWSGIAGWAVYKAVSDSRKPQTTATSNGEFVGKVGDVMTRGLVPTKYFPYTNKWGTAWAVHFDDAEGNHYVTFTSSRKIMDLVGRSIGRSLDLNFTIVGQEVDRGRNVNKIKSVATV